MLRRWALVLAVPAVMAAAACTVVVEPGSGTVPFNEPAGPVFTEPTTRVLDAGSLDQGVESVLQNDYKFDVDSVSCPSDEVVTVGNSFACQVNLGGDQVKQVEVTVKTTSGLYQVSQPH